MITVDVSDVDRMQKLLQTFALETIVEKGMELAIDKLRAQVIAHTPIYYPQKNEKLNHSPGQLHGGWSEPHSLGGGSFGFESKYDYSRVVEEGLFPKAMVVQVRKDGSPGRLIDEGGKVWSGREARGGMVGPLIKDNAMMESLGREIAAAVITAINGFLNKK